MDIKLEVSSDSSEVLELTLKLVLSDSRVIGFYFSEVGELCFFDTPQMPGNPFITPPSLESLKLMILDWLKTAKYPLPHCGVDDTIKPGWILVRDESCEGSEVFRIGPAWIFYGK